MDANFDPIAYINQVSWSTSRLGLDRTRELLERLGRPQDRLRFVHVAGTNGKGSTCAFIASILQEAGYAVGLFTSPAILDFTDRIRVNGCNITLDELREVTWEVREQAEQMADHPTEFELLTAVVFLHFARRGCDICVVEVGLGGQLDSSNVIEAPEVSVLTPISFDHVGVLGSTLTEIAQAKAGIIKDGAPVVSAPQPPEALAVVAAAAVAHQAPLTCVDADQIEGTPESFSYKGRESLRLGLLGSYQTENAATVLEVVDVLRERSWEIPEQAVRDGLANTSWPGRFERLSGLPPFIVDGGHNAQGAEALIESLEQRYPGRPVIFVMGVLGDKDYASMIRTIVAYPHTRAVYCTEPPNARALPASELAAAVQTEVERQNAQAIREHPLTRPIHEVQVREALSLEKAVEAAAGIALSLTSDTLPGGLPSDPFAALAGWTVAASYDDPVVVAFGSLYSVAAVTRAFRSWEAGEFGPEE